MTDTAAIVLAAGLSRRMGAANKLLERVGETALLRGMVIACAAISDHPVTVVTGHESDAVKQLLRGLPVRFVHNDRYAEGQMTSVDTGLRHAPFAQTYLLALGDQPKITVDCLRALLNAHHVEPDDRITVPMVNGVRGNPIVIPANHRASMLADPVNLGCRKLTRTSPEILRAFTTTDDSFVVDIDTPDDLARVRFELEPHREICR